MPSWRRRRRSSYKPTTLTARGRSLRRRRRSRRRYSRSSPSSSSCMETRRVDRWPSDERARRGGWRSGCPPPQRPGAPRDLNPRLCARVLPSLDTSSMTFPRTERPPESGTWAPGFSFPALPPPAPGTRGRTAGWRPVFTDAAWPRRGTSPPGSVSAGAQRPATRACSGPQEKR